MPEIFSRNLAAAEYDEDSQTLTVSFRSGADYEYAGVPQEVYEQLMQSIDPGGFFLAFIKNKYQYERIA